MPEITELTEGAHDRLPVLGLEDPRVPAERHDLWQPTAATVGADGIDDEDVAGFAMHDEHGTFADVDSRDLTDGRQVERHGELGRARQWACWRHRVARGVDHIDRWWCLQVRDEPTDTDDGRHDGHAGGRPLGAGPATCTATQLVVVQRCDRALGGVMQQGAWVVSRHRGLLSGRGGCCVPRGGAVPDA